jgi:hypothetical protein
MNRNIRLIFLLSIYDGNESIGFVHGKSIFFIEVLDELRLFNDKKVIVKKNCLYRPNRLKRSPSKKSWL